MPQNGPVRSRPISGFNTLFARYAFISTLVAIALGLGFGVYNQFFARTAQTLAISSVYELNKSGNTIAFQGRLSRLNGNPVNTPVAVVFRIFDAGTGGNELYNSTTGGSQTITPDSNGNFSVVIGQTNGLPIPDSVFANRNQVWLEFTANNQTIAPRQPISITGIQPPIPTPISIGATLSSSDLLKLDSLNISPRAGSILFGNGTSITNSSVGSSGQVLMSDGSGSVFWASLPPGIGGNYVGTISGNDQIGVTGSGVPNASVSLSIKDGSIGDTQLSFKTGQNLRTTDSPTFNNIIISSLNNAGSVIYSSGTSLAATSVGTSGQFLMSNGSGTPSWNTVSGTGSTYAAGVGLTLSSSNVFSLDLTSANTWTGLQTFNASGAPFAVGSTTLVTNLNAQYLNGVGSSGFDNYNNWKLQSNGTGTTSILSGNTVNFVNGVGISLAQSGSNITISNVGVGASYTAGVGLSLANNVFSLDLGSSNTWAALQTFGSINVGGTFVSVGSTNLVTNLNANYLNGFASSYFINVGQTGNFVSIGQTGNLLYVNNATNGTLTRSGTGPYTLALNLGSSNVWTGLQTFGNINVGGTFISVGSTNLVTNLNANYLNGFASSYFINVGQTGSLPYDNYNNWKLQSNGTGTTSILSGNTVNFVNGIGISMVQSGSTITINNNGVVGATNGLSLLGTNVGLGGTLTQNTNIGTSSFSLSFLGLGNSQSLYIASSGNVGIGVTSDNFLFSVLGDEANSNVASFTNLDASNTTNLSVLRLGIGTTNGNQPRFIQFYKSVTSDTGGTGVGRINLNNAGVQYSSGAADFAEYMNITESVTDGDIIATSVSGNKKAIMGDFVLGVVSDSAAFVANATSENPGPGQAIVGTMGLVNTKVSNENGNIAVGDQICASATNPGVGVKAKKAGPVIGKALAAYSSGTVGRIFVQVSPGWYDPDALLTNPNSFTLSGSNVLDPNGAIVSRIGGFQEITTSILNIGSTALVNNFNASFLNGLSFDNLPYINNTTDSTLTRSGTGPYTLALNLGSSNTWTGLQTFGSINLTNTSNQISFGVSGSKTILSADTQIADRVVTIPAITASDILVLNNKSAILTNKTIDAASNTITGLTTNNLSAGASIANTQLANSSITINTVAGSGLQGGGTVGLGGSLSLSFVSVGTPGTYGSATQIPVITLDQYGSVTNVTPTTISGLTSANLSASAGITNSQLSNSSISVNAIAGTGIGVSNSPVSLGGDLKLFGINATNTVKGVASFDATNFSVINGAVDTIQDINTAATPSFSSLFLTNTSNQLSLGTSNTTIISSLAPSTRRTAFIPALSSNDTFVFVGQTQTLTSKTISATNNTISNLTNANLSGSAGITDANLATITTANKVSGSAVQLNVNGGIVDSTGLSLLTSCSSTQILKWNGTAWVCANDSTGGTPSVYPDGGLISDSTGLSLLRTCADGQILKWFASSGWICHPDNTGGSGSITVEESDESVSVGDVVELQFGPATNSSDEFIVLDVGSSKARVRTGNKVVLTDLSQTLTNKTISGVGNTITNIGDSSLNTITTANKVSGSAVQLAVGGGLTNNSGLSLLTSCADQSLLLWDSGTSSWFCSTGGHPPINFLLGATASNSINNGDFAQVWNWNLTTAAKTAFTFGENIASINGAGAQYILGVSTKAGSTAAPFKVVAQNNTIIDTTAAGGVTIGSAAAGQPIEIHSGTGGINIGNSANEKTINIGSIDGASALNLLTGTGGFLLDGSGGTNYSIGASTTSGTFTIGGVAQTGTANLFTGNGGMNINIGTGAGANNIIFGNDTTTTSIQLLTGTGNILTKTANGNGMQFVTNTVTDDSIRIAAGLNGGTTSFQGTITEADLTAARTWTLQDNSGTIPLSTLGNGLFFTTSGNTNLTLPTSGTVTALGNSTTGSGSTLVLSTSPTFGTSIFTPLVIGGPAVNNTLTLSGNNALSGNSLTQPNINLNVGDSGATTAMTVLNNGYVGIGTTAPAGPLEVVAQNDFLYVTKYSNDVFSPGVVGRKARGTMAAPLAVQTDDKLASFGGRGYDGTSFPLGVLQSSGAFQVVAGENFTTLNKGTYLSFIVTPLGSTTRNEAMRLDTTGTLDLFNTTNQLSLGATNTTTISALAPTSSVVATIPALIGNDTFVFVGQTQTLTSKTLSAPILSNINVGTGNTGIFIDSSGNLTQRVFGTMAFSDTSSFVGVGQTGSLPYVNNATNGTLTRSGTGPYTLALNLGSSNVWTGLQTFTGGIGVTGSVNLTNNLTIGGTFVSVGSTNLVTNLNANYLNGISSSGFVSIGQTGSLPYVNNATDSTLTRSGTGPYTLALNLGSTNVWTAQQSFNGGISTTTSTALIIDSGTSGAINIGTNANAKTISIGNTVGTTTLNLFSGTGGINIGTLAVGSTISIGTGGTKTLLIGSTSSTSSTTIQSGNGNITFAVDGTNSSGQVIIGNSGTTTPDLLVLDNGTADPTGTNGGMYYNTSLNKFRCYQNGAWTNCIGGDKLFILKNTDQGSTITTLANDNNLQFSIGANETWIFKFHLIVFNTNSANPDWKSAVKAPAGTTCSVQLSGSEAAGAIFPQANTTDCTTPGTLINNNIGADANQGFDVWIQGYATAGATAGTVNLQFAQNTLSTGTPLVVKAGSFVEAFKVGGADLAEVYYADRAFVPGTVISLDPNHSFRVKESAGIYDKNVIGVVSSKPGLVIGDTTGSENGVATLVALSGRVPVKVSTENGPINSGDFLTSSSIPGVAMKATKAGNVIGQAMTSYNGSEIGEVIMFIKNNISNGASLDKNLTAIDILTSLVQQNNQIIPSSVDLSEVVTDRAVVGLEMITPKVTTQDIFAANATISGTLKVNTLQADKIEGLNFDSQLATLEAKIKDIEASHSAFLNLPIFNKLVEFFEKVIFHNRVQFEDKDMGGYAVIRQSTGEIEVKFDKPYEQIPVVNVSLVFENGDIPTFIEDGKNFIITNLTQEGFKISLLNLASRDFKYHWTALNIKDAKTFIIETTPVPTQTPIPTIIPTPTTTPIPSPTPTETIIPTETPSPTPTI